MKAKDLVGSSFLKTCPHCGRKISLRERKGLIWDSYDTCIGCAKQFQIQRKIMYINAGVFGGLSGIIGKAVFDLGIIENAISAVLVVLIFQRFVDYLVEPLEMV